MLDSSADGPVDAGVDAAAELPDADTADGAPDIADATVDILDAATDIVDAAPDIADASSPPAVVAAHYPPNGHTTGSIHVPASAGVVDHPQRPKLMWNAAAGASEYQVQLTSECTLSSFRSCPFSSPVVDTRVTATIFRPQTPLDVNTTVPVGRRYYWRVRACNASGCSAYSTVRYLDVGRHRKDFNGDGYADLIVGSSSQDNPETNEGQAYVFFGSATGPSLTPDVTLDNPLDQAHGRFGFSVASAGDVNGDGYADLIVGASSQDNPETDEGQAYIYFGSATGPSLTPDVTLDNPLDQANGYFGRSVASAGDVNGDGYANLIVGAYQQNNPETSEGQAYVFFGSATGPSVTPDVTLDNPLDQADGYFGYSVASAGDVNSNGGRRVRSSMIGVGDRLTGKGALDARGGGRAGTPMVHRQGGSGTEGSGYGCIGPRDDGV